MVWSRVIFAQKNIMSKTVLPPLSKTLPNFDKNCEKYGYMQATFLQNIHKAYYADPDRYQPDSEQDLVFSGSETEWGIPHLAKPLFMNFWFEGELACLFGDTNIGKSALAYEIASMVARQQDQPVAYFDLENTAHQFYNRYYDMKNNYSMCDNLYVFNITPHNVFPPRDIKKLLDGIECKIVQFKTPFVVIDDIFHLCSMNDCPTTDFVLRTLRHWTLQYKVAILVVAHSRRHHANTPIELRHLCGSRRLPYAFDSIFALNRTFLSTDTLYIKHIKSRNSVIEYDAKNVLLVKLKKVSPQDPLIFNFIKDPEITDERMLLHICNPASTAQALEKAQELSNLGWSHREIAEYFGISHTSVRRLLNTKTVTGASPGVSHPGTSASPAATESQPLAVPPAENSEISENSEPSEAGVSSTEPDGSQAENQPSTPTVNKRELLEHLQQPQYLENQENMEYFSRQLLSSHHAAS